MSCTLEYTPNQAASTVEALMTDFCVIYRYRSDRISSLLSFVSLKSSLAKKKENEGQSAGGVIPLSTTDHYKSSVLLLVSIRYTVLLCGTPFRLCCVEW